MIDTGDTDRAIARLQRALDDAYSRYAGSGESERVDGMATALEEALANEAPPLHAELLERLAEEFAEIALPCPVPPGVGDTGVRTTTSAGPDPALLGELSALRLEVERLRGAARRAPEPVRHVPSGLPEALLGADAHGVDAVLDPGRALSLVAELASFCADVGRAFLQGGTRGGGAQGDALAASLHGELAGTLPAGSVAARLGEIKQEVANQLEAVTMGCADGARQLLKELDPLVLEDGAREQLPRLGMFRDGELWKVYQRRHAELSNREDLYRAYFDGQIRKYQFRLRGSRS
jgi:hypothetical protein